MAKQTLKKPKPVLVKSTVFMSKKNECVEVEGRLLPFLEGVDLFTYKRKWWLRYSPTRCTGSFISKQKAMAFYNNGGR